jgi:hypothetical protein
VKGREWQTATSSWTLDAKEGGILQTGVVFLPSPIGPLIATVLKAEKLLLKFYVKAAGNVTSVETKKARRGQQ